MKLTIMRSFRTILFCFLLTAYSIGSAIAQNRPIHIIPEPAVIKSYPGNFDLEPNTKVINLSGNQDVLRSAEIFIKQISSSTGYAIKMAPSAKKNGKAIYLILNKTTDKMIGTEGYALSVNPMSISIHANKPAGIFYGLQTLLQLLPPEIASTTGVHSVRWTIPCVEISDTPRFGWRGLMLDVSRHFFSKEFIKEYLDQMAQYKFNVFHWHLTDDPGWRIEIKRYPELTKVGAWRALRTGRYWSFAPTQEGESATYGGYYTQEDIKEIIKYAQDRNITIVPEIDVPGHSMALIASYPSICCTGQKYPVYPGSNGGLGDNVLCAGNEETFKILDGIFTELADLFPGKYIHIGGDEVNKDFWKNCPKCQKRMTDEGLKDGHELQSYFIKRVEKILTSKGKKIIGWDEILEGGLAPSAVVMSWRGTDGGIAAAKAGHDVIMTPGQYCYLDYMQGEQLTEHMNWGHLNISEIYKFEPVPAGVDPKYILGGQGNVWAEHIPNARRVEYMTWPRAFALSEVFWSPKEKRNWNGFVTRMEAQFPRLSAENINYAPSIYDATIVPVKDKDGKMQLTFTTELNDLVVYYTFDCTFPDKYSTKYDQRPITIPIGASEIWAITYRNGKPAGRTLFAKLDELKSRM